MVIMISYANQDQAVVDAPALDLERAHLSVWVDRELTGGQLWWDAILAQIRSCELFVVALSPDALRSRACASELDYAARLERPILPVMVKDVAVQLAPPMIADAQIVDYRTRSVDSAIALISAVAARPLAPPLPSPLPAAPPTPISYMNAFREAVEADSLSFKDQLHLVAELRIFLQDPGDREVAAQLLRRLRQRPDIAESVGRELDQLLAMAPPASSIPRTSHRDKAGKASADRSAARPASTPGVATQELTPLLRRFHIVSAALLVAMIVDVSLQVPIPFGPILFFAAGAAGFGLSCYAISQARGRSERRGLRRGALVWGSIFAILVVFVVILLIKLTG